MRKSSNKCSKMILSRILKWMNLRAGREEEREVLREARAPERARARDAPSAAASAAARAAERPDQEAEAEAAAALRAATAGAAITRPKPATTFTSRAELMAELPASSQEVNLRGRTCALRRRTRSSPVTEAWATSKYLYRVYDET